MYLVVFDGLMGSGKTLAMSLLASYLHKKHDLIVYSNYSFYNSKEFNSFYNFLDIAKETKPVLLLLDEGHIDLDSGDFSTNAAKYFSHLFFYFRKLNCRLFITTPIFSNINTRFRSLCSILVSCSFCGDFFVFNIFDVQRNIFLKQIKIYKEHAFSCVENVYDTNSIVTPVVFPSNKLEFTELLSSIRSQLEKKRA